MNQKSTWMLPAILFLAVAGFLLPLWPLCAVGIVCAGFFNKATLAVLIGLFLDIAWGVPPGASTLFAFPFTELAVLSILARLLAERYLLGTTLPKKLY